jgi:ubiquinone/menaquinone biosynthesis C-methylase UbiE
MHTTALSNRETTKESYQATAKEYTDNVASLAPQESIKKFMTLLPPNAKIIDIGCASGRDAKIFNHLGVDVLGIDFCSNLIDMAKVHAPSVDFQLMDIENLNFPAASFEGAWAACALGHISKLALPDVLKKIHAILKEKGYFYLTLKKGVGETIEKDVRYNGNIQKFWSYYEEEELKDILQTAHFKILEFDTIEKTHPYQTHSALRGFCQKC